MSIRSLQHAGIALCNFCFQNYLFSFTSPELFCTLLPCLPKEIFLQGGVTRDFSVVAAELLSPVPQPLRLTQLARTSLGGIRRAS